ncbi:BMP-binding endothelial regulator protein-like [Glandiceps talaboti]
MLQDCIDTTPDWKIVIFNEKFKYSQIVSYISAVEIQLADHVIKLGPRDLVTVDRQTVADNIDHFDFDNEDLSLKKSNNNVVFYYRRTFSVSFNGIHRVDVAVSPDLKNKVCGLLGNNDGDPSNDMMKPNGDMATDADDFSKSWETEVCAE